MVERNGGCDRCGGAVQMTANDGGIESGRFSERYECVDCGATGRISGEASDPAQRWSRTGAVFGGAV